MAAGIIIGTVVLFIVGWAIVRGARAFSFGRFYADLFGRAGHGKFHA